MAHLRMYDDSNPTIQRLREVCLGLGDVVEKEAWGECTFRAVGGSMFAMTDNDHHGSGHIAVWVKAPEMAQEILVNAQPSKFFRPPYLGHKGWVGVRLEGTIDWGELAEILRDGYLMSAPRKPRVAAGSGAAKRAVAKRKRSVKSPARRQQGVGSPRE